MLRESRPWLCRTKVSRQLVGRFVENDLCVLNFAQKPFSTSPAPPSPAYLDDTKLGTFTLKDFLKLFLWNGIQSISFSAFLCRLLPFRPWAGTRRWLSVIRGWVCPSNTSDAEINRWDRSSWVTSCRYNFGVTDLFCRVV